MISSMTGYGRGVHTNNKADISVEIKSVNNRFLDVALKLPRVLSAYEQHVRELVGKYVERGRVSIWVNIKTSDEKYEKFSLNRPLLDAYMSLISDIKNSYNVSGELKLHEIVMLPDVIVVEADDDESEEKWSCTKAALEEALKQLVEMRDREGIEIKKDFVVRINSLEADVKQIQELSSAGPQEELAKLKERAKRLISNNHLDEYRLELELALISDKIDVSEECTRFFSHITLFREMLDSDKSEGRKLNFLLQEMNREANTMASKAYTADISHTVVKIKEDIEKIREQVQNIE